MGTGKNIVAPRFEARGITITGQLIYEQVMYYLDGLAEDAVPVGGAAPYRYDYVGPTTAWVDPRYQTLVCGNGIAVYGLTSAVLESLSFSWQWGEIVQMTSTWMGSSVDDDTLAALTEPTDAVTTEATGCHAILYVYETGDGYGGERRALVNVGGAAGARDCADGCGRAGRSVLRHRQRGADRQCCG
jgi:hypothetical protein